MRSFPLCHWCILNAVGRGPRKDSTLEPFIAFAQTHAIFVQVRMIKGLACSPTTGSILESASDILLTQAQHHRAPFTTKSRAQVDYGINQQQDSPGHRIGPRYWPGCVRFLNLCHVYHHLPQPHLLHCRLHDFQPHEFSWPQTRMKVGWIRPRSASNSAVAEVACGGGFLSHGTGQVLIGIVCL